MKLELGGNLRVRLLIIYSFFNLIDKSDENFSMFCDFKPALSLAAMDFFEKRIHSYPVLVSKCAEEFHANLPMLDWSSEKIKTKFGESLYIKNLAMLLLIKAEKKSS